MPVHLPYPNPTLMPVHDAPTSAEVQMLPVL